MLWPSKKKVQDLEYRVKELESDHNRLIDKIIALEAHLGVVYLKPYTHSGGYVKRAERNYVV
jgi:hypothetical protein